MPLSGALGVSQLKPVPSFRHEHEEGKELNNPASSADRQSMTPAALSLKPQSDYFLSLIQILTPRGNAYA